MYENYTKQSLPTREYRELLGSAMCLFNSNNSFIIENILHTDNAYDWYVLMDKTSGELELFVSKTISEKCGNTSIADLFHEIINMRNRIFHSYQSTSFQTGQQVLMTKTKQKDGNEQFEITEQYLKEFIRMNDELSDLLHNYRGY